MAGLALLALTPTAAATPTVSFDQAATATRWSQGFLTGSVRFRGQVSEPATLLVFVRRASNRGPVLASQQLDVAAAGAFSGTLRLPVQPMPATYKLRVSLVTEAGNVLLGAARNVVIPAPPEGVVARAVVSRARGGTNVTAVGSGVREMWVRFRFLSPPARGRTVRVVWFTPDARILGIVLRTSTIVVDSYIRGGGGAAIPKGNWEARLIVGGTTARRTFVRIR